MSLPKNVGQDEWLAARKELLAREKEFTRQRDALSEARRKLPMVKVEKDYQFEGPKGNVTLRDLFDGHRQLIVYHFMFDPTWSEGCKGCSFVMDNLQGGLVHLGARDTSFVAISRAPLEKLEPFKKRMGWTFPWFSSFDNEFNYDFRVTVKDFYNFAEADASKKGEMPGLSVFVRDGENIFHTYSTYARGLDLFLDTYNLLDVTPLGRQEERGKHMDWLRHHDKYAPKILTEQCHCS